MGELDRADPDPTLSPAVSAAIDELRRDFETRLAALQRSFASEMRAATDAARQDGVDRALPLDLDPVVEVARAVDAATSQADILTALVEGAGGLASRAIFFVRRGDSLGAWGSFGFDGFEEVVSAAELSGRDLGEVRRCLAGDGSVLVDPATVSDWLGAEAAESMAEGLLVPFVLRGEVAGALYADRAADGSWHEDGLRLLAWLTAKAIETLAGSNGHGSAAWSVAAVDVEAEIETAEAEEEPVEAAASEDELDAELMAEDAAVATPTEEASAPAAEIAESEVEADEPAPEVSTATPEDDELEAGGYRQPQPRSAEPEEGGDPDRFDVSTVAIPTPDFSRPRTAPPPEADEAKAEAEDSTEVRPPDDLQGPGWAFTATGTDSQAEEARRLARLLVTEIKLYNQDKLAEGRAKGNVYSALREDIDRSRRIFKERVGEQEDYFEEALVQILADGDADLLGS